MVTYTDNQPYKFITSPCTRTRTWGAVDRQSIPKGTNALQKGLDTLHKGS